MKIRRAVGAVEKPFSFERPAAGDLRRASIRGGISTITAEGLSYVLRVASMIVLARWLAPEDFGLIGMVTALTVFAERFKDLGLDVATVQREHLTHQQVSTLFWINLGVGVVIALLVAAFAPLIAHFYSEARLVSISVALATTFLFGGATIQHQALLRRQMRFGDLAWIAVVSTALSFVAGVGLAWYGFGYWALVWREVVRTAAIAAGAWMLCAWVPALPRRSPEIRSMMQVGSNITGFNIVYFVSRSFDQILIGRIWGAGPLGFYRQSHQLVMLPLSLLHFPLNYVALPALSALRSEPQRYRLYYREITSVVAFLCMPMLMYLAIYAEPLIVLALGDKWRPAAPVFSVMAVAGFAWPISGTAGTVMISTNASRRYFWLGLANAATLSVAFLIGVKWGPVGVAAAFAVWTYLTLVPSLLIAFHGTPVSIRDSFEAAGSPVAASLVTAALLIVVSRMLNGFDRVAVLAISLFIGIVAYLAVSLALPGGREKLRGYIGYGRTAFRQAAAAGRRGLAVQES